ncbi:hypothetical protein RI367_005670 [Sorochytrium milnesiophthora]
MAAISGIGMLNKSKEVLFTVDNEYVFEIAYHPRAANIAVSASNHLIKLYDFATLDLKHALQAHDASISHLEYHPADPNLVLSGSADATLKVWDLRTAAGPVSMIQTPKRQAVTAFSVNASGEWLSVGTELSRDASIHFYDMRTLSSGAHPAHTFSEVHADDVTRLRFHPERPAVLLSGSTDGLACVYDLQAAGFDEDEAAVAVLNSGSSVNLLGWFGPSLDHICMTTHIETVSLWGAEGTLLKDFGDVRTLAQNQFGITIDYVVDCHYDAAAQQLALIVGSHTGDLAIFQVQPDALQLSYAAPVGKAHHDVIRSVAWDVVSGTMVSGGEDARLCQWSLSGHQQQQHHQHAAVTSPTSGARTAIVKGGDLHSKRRTTPY